MIQKQISENVPLLDNRGILLYPGYSTRVHHQYDPSKAKTFPFRLKEWDFYQFHLGEWILQMTIGHVSYATSIGAVLFSTSDGTRYDFGSLYPLKKKDVHWSLNPELPGTLEIHEKDYDYVMETGKDYKRLTLKTHPVSKSATSGGGDAKIDTSCTGDLNAEITKQVDIDLYMPWDPAQDKMIIATPFDKPHQFYYNCKEHYYDVKGHVRFENQEILVEGDKTGMLDWGRGVWPFHQEWFWGCGGDYQCNGRFGINIGWGFGNLEHASENMFFWNGKAYKLGHLMVERDENNYMEPWHFYTTDGIFDMVMTPVYDNYTETKVAFVNNHCHQVFGKYTGTAKLPDGTVLEIKDMLAFCEHAVNNW